MLDGEMSGVARHVPLYFPTWYTHWIRLIAPDTFLRGNIDRVSVTDACISIRQRQHIQRHKMPTSNVDTHWGTWVLTEEDVLEPPRLLKKALTKAGIPETGTFDVCEIGESREFM